MLHYDRRVATADISRYLDEVPIHRHLPRELAALGHEVHVVHLYPSDRRHDEGGVSFHFVASSAAIRLGAEVLAKIQRRDPAVYEPALRPIGVIRDLKPDVVHFHGLTLTWNLFLTTLLLPRSVPIVTHYHGGYPPSHPAAARVHAIASHRISRFLFTEKSQSQPFIASASIRDPTRVIELAETSTTFRQGGRARARRQTGLVGDPVYLWTGRLDPLKDPETALLGFEQILRARPEAQLYLYYLTDLLLPQLTQIVRQRPNLFGHVHFKGKAPPGQMEAIYNSADFFLQASTREVCGTSVLEAMACGTIPIISDIPPFRKLTGEGQFGKLFRPGDPGSLARVALSIPVDAIDSMADQLADYFERELSFRAMAGRLDGIYRQVA